MKTVKEWPRLFAKASIDKTKQWKIWVETENDKVYITTEHGYIDGKQTITQKEIKTGKNIGKTNETTRVEQAISDAQSKYNKKSDAKYSETIEQSESSNILLPQLAHNYAKRSHNIIWPCYVQPKLDGIRCLARKSHDSITYTSRKNKPFNTLEHLTKDLVDLNIECPNDGELYCHQEITFQEITRRVKKLRDNTNEINYWIYDIVDTQKSFKERKEALELAFYNANGLESYYIDIDENEEIAMCKVGNLVLTPTYKVENEDEMKEWHGKFCAAGFEGTIIRNIDGKYVCDHRSADLQKYKDFLDSEFEIVGGKEATGLDEGTAVLRCKTKDGKEFDVRPKGTREYRRELWNNLDDLIGKELTVRYQELTEEGIPRFPVGLVVRDFE